MLRLWKTEMLMEKCILQLHGRIFDIKWCRGCVALTHCKFETLHKGCVAQTKAPDREPLLQVYFMERLLAQIFRGESRRFENRSSHSCLESFIVKISMWNQLLKLKVSYSYVLSLSRFTVIFIKWMQRNQISFIQKIVDHRTRVNFMVLCK